MIDVFDLVLIVDTNEPAAVRQVIETQVAAARVKLQR